MRALCECGGKGVNSFRVAYPPCSWGACSLNIGCYGNFVSTLSCVPGVRYFVRGVDGDGHAANYVETEQLIGFKNSWGSFVQVMATPPLWLNFIWVGGLHHTHTHTPH